MDRRLLLQGFAAALLVRAGIVPAQFVTKGPPKNLSVDDLQRNWKALLAKDAKVATDVAPITRSDAEWRQTLDPAAYNVLRHEGTERPLFTSAMKFDSGTGWPSYFTTIPGVFATKTDHQLIMARTEYHCAKCGGHHGHIFDDGPQPTGLRYCNNGVALRFVPLDAKAA